MRALFYPKEPQIRENAVKHRLHEHQVFGALSHFNQTSQGGELQAKLNTGDMGGGCQIHSE